MQRKTKNDIKGNKMLNMKKISKKREGVLTKILTLEINLAEKI